MADMSDFQLFTQKEFDDALAEAKAEIMAMAIEASRTAVMMEREACAKIVDNSYENSSASEPISVDYFLKLAEEIRNRIPSQRAQ
jgi:hypothetical protein